MSINRRYNFETLKSEKKEKKKKNTASNRLINTSIDSKSVGGEKVGERWKRSNKRLGILIFRRIYDSLHLMKRACALIPSVKETVASIKRQQQSRDTDINMNLLRHKFRACTIIENRCYYKKKTIK